MSLNHREIDLVLSELNVVGSQIQRIVQPTYDTLVLSLYKPGNPVDLLVCLSHGACRIHATTVPAPKSAKPLRFAELLKSRIRNGRIQSIRQLGAERIVRMDIRVSADSAGPDFIRYRLYARLWSGAANLILTDDSGTIVDALARKPKRGEVSGGTYRPEEAIAIEPSSKPFEIRDLPGPGTFNERVDRLYALRRGELSRDHLLVKVREWFSRRIALLEARAAELGRTEEEYADAERLRELGDILMGSVGTGSVESGYLETEDFFRGGVVRIRIDSKKSLVENAQTYYERYRKAESGLADVRVERREILRRIAALTTEAERLETEENPFVLRAFLARRRATAAAKRPYPGISLERDGWILLVGRSAKENDELLRRYVRGNDLWLHVRDQPGSYVFIKNRPGQSVPLEILLDAGNLALYYSKKRKSGQGDLYYTRVKYLRRVKDGPKGLVIPTQEKNLHVIVEENRIRSLRSLIGKEPEEA